MRLIVLALVAMACVGGARDDRKQFDSNQETSAPKHGSVGRHIIKYDSKVTIPNTSASKPSIDKTQSPRIDSRLEFGVSTLNSEPMKTKSNELAASSFVVADTVDLQENTTSNENETVEEMECQEGDENSDLNEDVSGYETDLQELEPDLDLVSEDDDFEDSQENFKDPLEEKEEEHINELIRSAGDNVVSDESSVSDEPSHPVRRGLREIHSIKFESPRSSKKVQKKQQKNEYKDPDSVDHEKNPAAQKGPLVRRSPNAEEDTTSFMEKVSESKSEDFHIKEYDYFLMEEDVVSENLAKTEEPRRHQGGYITNNIEDGDFINSPEMDVPNFAKNKRKKSRVADLLRRTSTQNKTSYGNKTISRPPSHRKSKYSSGKARQMLDRIEENPSLERLPGEDTFTYVNRIYPKLKEIMEAEEEEDKIRGVTRKFFRHIFSLFIRKNDEQSDDNTLNLLSNKVTNGTKLKTGLIVVNSANTLKLISSPLAGIMFVLLLTI